MAKKSKIEKKSYRSKRLAFFLQVARSLHISPIFMVNDAERIIFYYYLLIIFVNYGGVLPS